MEAMALVLVWAAVLGFIGWASKDVLQLTWVGVIAAMLVWTVLAMFVPALR